MKLEDQVCSLDQSKLLYQFGITTGSYFYWHLGTIKNEWLIIDKEHSHITNNDYPAFLVAELGRIISLKSHQGLVYHLPKPYSVNSWYSSFNESVHSTEAKARAAMLIKMLKEKRITITEVKKRLKK